MPGTPCRPLPPVHGPSSKRPTSRSAGTRERRDRGGALPDPSSSSLLAPRSSLLAPRSSLLAPRSTSAVRSRRAYRPAEQELGRFERGARRGGMPGTPCRREVRVEAGCLAHRAAHCRPSTALPRSGRPPGRPGRESVAIAAVRCPIRRPPRSSLLAPRSSLLAPRLRCASPGVTARPSRSSAASREVRVEAGCLAHRAGERCASRRDAWHTVPPTASRPRPFLEAADLPVGRDARASRSRRCAARSVVLLAPRSSSSRSSLHAPRLRCALAGRDRPAEQELGRFERGARRGGMPGTTCRREVRVEAGCLAHRAAHCLPSTALPRSGRPPGRPGRESVAIAAVRCPIRRPPRSSFLVFSLLAPRSTSAVRFAGRDRPAEQELGRFERGARRGGMPGTPCRPLPPVHGPSSKRPTSRSAGTRERRDRGGALPDPSSSSLLVPRLLAPRFTLHACGALSPGVTARPSRSSAASREVRVEAGCLAQRAGERCESRRDAWHTVPPTAARPRPFLEAADLPVGRDARASRSRRCAARSVVLLAPRSSLLAPRSTSAVRFAGRDRPAEQELGRFERGARRGGMPGTPCRREVRVEAGCLARRAAHCRPSTALPRSGRPPGRPGRESVAIAAVRCPIRRPPRSSLLAPRLRCASPGVTARPSRSSAASREVRVEAGCLAHRAGERCESRRDAWHAVPPTAARPRPFLEAADLPVGRDARASRSRRCAARSVVLLAPRSSLLAPRSCSSLHVCGAPRRA
jgi:hypothetical protein